MIDFDDHKNLSITAVATPPSPADSGDTFDVVDPSVLPAPPFDATVWAEGELPTVANAEVVRVLDLVGSTVTVERGVTSSRSIQAGDLFIATISDGYLDSIEQALQAAWTIIGDLGVASAAQATDISELESRLTVDEGRILGLELASGAASAAIVGLESELANVEVELAQASAAITGAVSRVDAIDLEIDALSAASGAASAAITGLGTRMGAAEVTLGVHGGQIAGLGLASAAASAAITASDIRAGQASAATDRRLDDLELASAQINGRMASAEVTLNSYAIHLTTLDYASAGLYASAGWASAAADLRLDSLEAASAAASAAIGQIVNLDGRHVGELIPWTRSTLPAGGDYAWALGGTYTKAAYPEGYAVALAEVAAGNLLWTVNVNNETFTVPNVYDKFLIGSGSMTLGASGGASAVALSSGEMPRHAHGSGNLSAVSGGAHTHAMGHLAHNPSQAWSAIAAAAGGSFWAPTSDSNIVDRTATDSGGAHTHLIDGGTASAGLGLAHENRPPFLVMGYIVKLRGLVVTASAVQGPQGVAGSVGYDTAPIGAVIQWTRRTLPANGEWVVASGGTYRRTEYPDAYLAASAEVAAGNPLWSIDTVNQTFTPPDLRDKFVYASGAFPIGFTGGASAVTLSSGQLPSHAHADGTLATDSGGSHTHGPGGGGTGFLETGSPTFQWAPTPGGGYSAGNGATTAAGGTHSHDVTGQTAAAGGGASHNNMPPFVVLGYIVKLKGVSLAASAIQGPSGPPGVPARGVVSVSSQSLAPGASGIVSAPLGPSFSIVKIESDRPAWVRLYISPASAVADGARASAAALPEDAGLILDYVLPTSSGSFPLAPMAWGYSESGASAVSGIFTNYGPNAGPVTVRFTAIPLEYT